MPIVIFEALWYIILDMLLCTLLLVDNTIVALFMRMTNITLSPIEYVSCYDDNNNIISSAASMLMTSFLLLTTLCWEFAYRILNSILLLIRNSPSVSFVVWLYILHFKPFIIPSRSEIFLGGCPKRMPNNAIYH